MQDVRTSAQNAMLPEYMPPARSRMYKFKRNGNLSTTPKILEGKSLRVTTVIKTWLTPSHCLIPGEESIQSKHEEEAETSSCSILSQ